MGLRNGISIQGDAGAVGTTIAHLNQHRGQQLAQTGIERLVLQIDSNNSAHDLFINPDGKRDIAVYSSIN